MWAHTPGYTEGVGYAPLIPPPPPPQNLQNFSMPASNPQYPIPPATPRQNFQQHPPGGRGRAHRRNRGSASPRSSVQSQGHARMPAGLAGPWQAGHQQQEVIQESNVKTSSSITGKSPVPTPQNQQEISTVQTQAAQKQPTGGGQRIPQESKGGIDIAAVKIKLLEGLMNVKAETYPKELLEKFSPLRCDLCVAKMNSTLQAKMHYNGKQHEKKVRMFLVNSQNTGEPVAKKVKLEEAVVQAVPPEPKVSTPVEVPTPATESNIQSLYCKCCDLSFTSALHAEQHYTGRNHQRVLSGKIPLKSGYFNFTTGKWQRKPPEDPTGRFGIGATFMSEEQIKEAEEMMAEQEKKGRFYCNTCNIGATSQEQLDMHFHGSKHRKMLASKLQKASSSIECVAPTLGTEDTLLKSVTKDLGSANNKTNNKDLSFFRTPSGKFYCQPCNITLNSESQFLSHTESKKHKVKLASQKPAMTLTGPKAEQWGDKSSALWAA